MARPRKWRICSSILRGYFFKPRGASVSGLNIAELAGDELEAMRLCDVVDLDHEDAADRVGISRRTLERLLRIGRYKVVNALARGSAIRISFPEHVKRR
jgi:predicted DNA-binding protein (UPF0251 family)